MKWRRRDLGRWTLAAAAAALSPASRGASPGAPRRPLRLIVVYPPGGVSDGMARALATQLEPLLGETVIVDNRPGAGGSVGIDALARAAPDGRTLAFSAMSPLTLQPLLSSVPYDPERSVRPVASVMRTPVLVAGTPAFEDRGFPALIAQAQRRPGAVRWATSGVATVGHLVLAQVRMQSRTVITHVPYQGGGPQLNDALGGQFEVLSTNVAAPQLQYVTAGRLQALAVGAPGRLAALPEVPTLSELGFAGANLDSLFGLYAPARTPTTVVERLNDAVNEALRSESLRDRLRDAHNLSAGGSIDAFAREIANDRLRNRDMVRHHPKLFD